MLTPSEIGSLTALGGFINERLICEKFNNWLHDSDAQQWLSIMNYELKTIKEIKAIQIPLRINKDRAIAFGITEEDYLEVVKYKKSDAQVKLTIKVGDIIKVENISIKKSDVSANFNQVDKRSVSTYQVMWGFNDEIRRWLEGFTGYRSPGSFPELEGIKLRDDRRLFFTEIPAKIQNLIIDFLQENKFLIVADILKGRGGLSANWLLVTRNNRDGTANWLLKDINYAINYFSKGPIVISPKGSLWIGKVFMQRKGGTPDPTSLQFKIKPCDIFTQLPELT